MGLEVDEHAHDSVKTHSGMGDRQSQWRALIAVHPFVIKVPRILRNRHLEVFFVTEAGGKDQIFTPTAAIRRGDAGRGGHDEIPAWLVGMEGMFGVDETECRGPAAYLAITGQHASNPCHSAADGTGQGTCMGQVTWKLARLEDGDFWSIPGLKTCWISRHELPLPPYALQNLVNKKS